MVSEDMKLKFCPFCGGTARIKPKRRLSGKIYGYHLYHTCKHTNPQFTISSHGDVDSKTVLIEHWNRRCEEIDGGRQ